jgi:hypothetical protein
MRRHRPLAGILAVGSVVLAAVGETLALAHAGSALGLALVAAAAPVAIAAWLALGAPIRRCRVGS